jgi:hypothetical protein
LQEVGYSLGPSVQFPDGPPKYPTEEDETMSATNMTKAEIETLAIQDYEKVLNTVITVKLLTGYKDDNQHDFDGKEYQVRVVKTEESDILHWNDKWLDPYWNVEIVGEYPELVGFRSFWTYGTSYREDLRPSELRTIDNV